MTASVATLFHEAERLDNRSLDTFIAHILSLRVQRKTPDKQKEEADLLQKINKSLSIQEIDRFIFLNENAIRTALVSASRRELLRRKSKERLLAHKAFCLIFLFCL